MLSVVQKNKKQYVLYGSLVRISLAGVHKLRKDPSKIPSPLIPHTYAHVLRVFV